MKFISIVAVTLLMTLKQGSATLKKSPQAPTMSPKKGIGLSESRGFGAAQLDSLQVSWYYNWSFTSDIHTNKTYIPMVFSINTIEKITKSKIILGFNEPDNSNQSDISIDMALDYWSALVQNADRVGSPATAGNPTQSEGWLYLFMQHKPTVDFITMHWYKGCNIQKFIKDVKNVIDTYHMPVWITEFAPQTVAESAQKPHKYTAEQVVEFIKKAIHFLEQEPMVEKYAWHDSKTGNCAIFTDKGELTLIGKAYRDAK